MSHEELRPEEFAQAADAAIADALTRADPRAMAEVLAQAGLCGVMAAEDDGGLGLDLAFALPIAHAAGRLRLPLPLPEQILLARALAGTPQAAALAAGERLAGIAWHGSLQTGHARVDNGLADWVLVADGAGAALIDASAQPHEPQAVLDPEHPQTWIALAGAPVLARLDEPDWDALRRQAHLLLAEFANGAAEGALQAAADYMATRVQFGRPLSAKQAVRHLLARMRLLQDVSSAAIRRATQADEYGKPRDTRPALAGALANAAFVIEKAIHLHGGMGFTWELPLHRALRAVRRLDAAFAGLSRDAGRAFIQSV
ncbi:acyl-CoA dehydrogenase family protein [Achromobacter sp. MFA1 R4]|uniref:acyl-CoA dehydrogenase family protein n=1 Tax=Achromobacter sp. MFA1 R4 TaxID=1881016 RepID=UPI0009536AA3|nr:acyl-CoA dehydrogenase family protein [Achromobacter sp. MFA1 R4]SIT14133.1 Acyl-CoA dehydrogenase, C-terminal domain [Achromobacter sp. MFA1 R4]